MFPANEEYGYASHLPILIECVCKTTGPVLELGAGLFSTPMLHELCAEQRRLVTVETNPDYFRAATKYATDGPEGHLVLHDPKAIPEFVYSVVLVDSGPADTRVPYVKQFAEAEFLVCHDWPYDPYKYPIHDFRFADVYTKLVPWTLVLSNERRR